MTPTPDTEAAPAKPSKIKRFRLLPPPMPSVWQAPVVSLAALSEALAAGQSLEAVVARMQQTQLPNPGLSFRALLVTAVRTPLNGQSLDTLEMHKSSRLFSLFDDKQDNDIFECDQEADWAFLLEKVKAVRWNFFDPQIDCFLSTIENATADVLN